MNGKYEAREGHMAKYLAMAKGLMARFQSMKVEYIPRAIYVEVDLLS